MKDLMIWIKSINRKYSMTIFQLTLSYLLIILATFLFALNIDNYKAFNYRGNGLEAQRELRSVHSKQLIYRKEKGYFAVNFADMGYITNKGRYTIFYNDTLMPSVWNLKESLPSYYKCVREVDKWNAYAVANLDADSGLDIWMVDEKGDIYHLQDDYRISGPSLNVDDPKFTNRKK